MIIEFIYYKFNFIVYSRVDIEIRNENELKKRWENYKKKI